MNTESIFTAEQSDKIDKIVEALENARRVLFITGAGMSAESGLPTYRGIGGLYNNNETVEGLTIEECLSATVFRSRPELTWKYLGEIEKAARAARYNRGHEIIVEFEKQFETWTLTQNVDGFHALAGSQNLIEIHGTMRRLRCTSCALVVETESYGGLSIPPYCEQCESMMRPDVVLFEEMLPDKAQQQYHDAMLDEFDVTFSVGTTSAFPYIAGPIFYANQQGNVTVEINPSETTVSDEVTYRLQLPAAKTLEEIWSRVSKSQ